MLLVIREIPWSAVAVVGNFKSGALQALNQARAAQHARSFLGACRKCRSAGRRPNQGNLLRLTDNFDRQRVTPCVSFPVPRWDVYCSGAFPCRTEKLLTPRSCRDGGQFRRQCESYILADEVQIALIRETKLCQPLANLLDQNFGSGSSSSQANALDASKPVHVNILGGIDKLRTYSAALCHLH